MDSIFSYVGQLLQNLVSELRLFLQALTYLVDVSLSPSGLSSFGWMPSLFLSALVLLFTLVLVLRIIGR